MSQSGKVLQAILSGRSDQNIRFSSLQSALERMGFNVRVRGSHHIFSRDGIIEIINLQPRPDGTAKPYQVKQVRELIVKHQLGIDE
jgi:predicted RNA binding protein YcfA (HicA-like mRNA interferase family)